MHKRELKIKVCGMKQLPNIKLIEACKPDYMGFIFHSKSPRYFTTSSGNSLPNITDKIGVFVNENEFYIHQKIQQYSLKGIQLHGDESPEFCKLFLTQTTVFKAFQLHENFNFTLLEKYTNCVHYFLFDTQTQSELRGGTGHKFNWDILANYLGDTPFFLSGGIQLEDASLISKIEHPQIQGIDINSGFEISPGVKSVEKVKKFINQIRK